MGVCELVGNTPPSNPIIIYMDKMNRHAAGLQTFHTDDLDLQKFIVPKLSPLEDKTLVRKITEDRLGGTVLKAIPFGTDRIFGVPTVRDPAGRMGRGPKKLADSTVFNF